MHSLRSAAVQYTNYGTGGAFELPTQSGTLIVNSCIVHSTDDLKMFRTIKTNDDFHQLQQVCWSMVILSGDPSISLISKHRESAEKSNEVDPQPSRLCI